MCPRTYRSCHNRRAALQIRRLYVEGDGDGAADGDGATDPDGAAEPDGATEPDGAADPDADGAADDDGEAETVGVGESVGGMYGLNAPPTPKRNPFSTIPM